MEWVKEKPTKEGWYWVKVRQVMKAEEAEVVNIVRGWRGMICKFTDRDQISLADNSIADRYRYEWYGPISPPIEQKDK